MNQLSLKRAISSCKIVSKCQIWPLFFLELREHESTRVPYISEEARAKLKEILAIEYDFYNFLSQRVERQHKQLMAQIEDAGDEALVSDEKTTL